MRCAKAVLARRRRTRRGRRPLAWADTRCTEPGRPCLWPGVSQGRTVHPSGARPWCTGAGSRTASESRGSRRTQGAPGDRRRRWREGSWPRGTWRSQPGAGRRAGVAWHLRSAASGRPLWVPARRPEAGARCGRAARRDLCGGCWVTGIPTATCSTVSSTAMCGRMKP
jgi:hypothetical protein